MIARVGGTVTYELSATNNGPDLTGGVVLSDRLPAHTRLVRVTPSQGTCTRGAVVSCALGPLARSGSASVTIVVRALRAGTLANELSVGALARDRNMRNNVLTIRSTVLARPLVSHFSQSHRVWRKHPPGHGHPVGTTFRFTLNQRADVGLVFTHRRGRRTVTDGTVTLAGLRGGAHRVHWRGRVSRTRSLAPGTYTVTIIAKNATGATSVPASLTFTIVR